MFILSSCFLLVENSNKRAAAGLSQSWQPALFHLALQRLLIGHHMVLGGPSSEDFNWNLSVEQFPTYESPLVYLLLCHERTRTFSKACNLKGSEVLGVNDGREWTLTFRFGLLSRLDMFALFWPILSQRRPDDDDVGAADAIVQLFFHHSSNSFISGRKSRSVERQ